MSEVWRAHDATLDRTVALKILSPTADLDRFRREAHSLATLSHENIMRVFDYGEDAAGPFMALEWLDGGTLEGRLAQGPRARHDLIAESKEQLREQNNRLDAALNNMTQGLCMFDANEEIVVRALEKLRDEHDSTIVTVTHSPFVAQASDRIVELHDGRAT